MTMIDNVDEVREAMRKIRPDFSLEHYSIEGCAIGFLSALTQNENVLYTASYRSRIHQQTAHSIHHLRRHSARRADIPHDIYRSKDGKNEFYRCFFYNNQVLRKLAARAQQMSDKTARLHDTLAKVVVNRHKICIT